MRARSNQGGRRAQVEAGARWKCGCVRALFHFFPPGAMLLIIDAPSATTDIRGFTLLLPALSVGNVDQLAVDLILNTLLHLPPTLTPTLSPTPTRARRLGWLHAPGLVEPVVGQSAVGPDDGALAHSLELFSVDSARVAILQQRAAARPGQQEALAAALFAFAREAGVARIVVAAAADAGARPDAYLRKGPHVLYAETTGAGAGAGVSLPALDLEGAGISRWSPATAPAPAPAASSSDAVRAPPSTAAAAPSPSIPPPAPGWIPPTDAAVAATTDLFAPLFGTGYAPVYFRRAASGGGDGPPLTCVFTFAAEGENRPEASTLAAALARALGLKGEGDGPLRLVEPAYWASLSGPGFDQALFG
jgi:hypothetical protein